MGFIKYKNLEDIGFIKYKKLKTMDFSSEIWDTGKLYYLWKNLCTGEICVV